MGGVIGQGARGPAGATLPRVVRGGGARARVNGPWVAARPTVSSLT